MNAAEAKTLALLNESRRIEHELKYIKAFIKERAESGHCGVHIEHGNHIHEKVWEILKAEGYKIHIRNYSPRFISW